MHEKFGKWEGICIKDKSGTKNIFYKSLHHKNPGSLHQNLVGELVIKQRSTLLKTRPMNVDDDF